MSGWVAATRVALLATVCMAALVVASACGGLDVVGSDPVAQAPAPGAVTLSESRPPPTLPAPDRSNSRPAEPSIPPATQSVSTQPVAYECRWANEPVTIDGKADDSAWAGAQPLDAFRLAWLGAGERPPRTGTKARLLWDREYVYFFAEMADADLFARVSEHDGEVWTDDAFELFFKPAADKPGYYEFNFNPANAVLDMFLPRRNAGGYPRFKGEGEFHAETAVQLNGTLNKWGDSDTGWSVEGRIPWKSFLRTGGRPEVGEEWTFAACRIDVSVEFEGPELSSSAVLNGRSHPDFHAYEDYAPIRFVGPVDEGAKSRAAYGLKKLAPLMTSTVVGSPDPPKPYRLVTAFPKLKVKYPVAVAHQPGSDRLWVIGAAGPWAPGTLFRIVDSPDAEEPELLTAVDGNAYSLTFHPNFVENGYVYVGRNGPASATKPEDKKSQIVRYTVDPKPPYTFDVNTETVIIEWTSGGHDGCAIDFGPDGMLYVTSGDGTSDSDTWLSGQDLSRPLAKVMRIDVDHPEPGEQYSVPKDNPFVGEPNVVPETWAYGMRNPWRIDVDDKTGHVWVGQNGQDQWEQIYLIEKGANYGWSVTEGSHPFYPNRKRGPHPISPPIAEHPHAEARSITGGIVYHGAGLPGLTGAYLYGDYSTGKIWGIRVDENRKVTWHQEIADTTAQITSFALDSKGDLLITDHGGHRICRLEPVPQSSSASNFPRTLSDSGLFKSVKDHQLADGVVPYSVNAELWSDGAYKERFIAIPAKPSASTGLPIDDDRRIGFTNWRGWEFPNETVLIKSFAIETQAGNPASRKWIETRFLTRQEGEWAGYSYRWNEEQTDATLVDGGGLDQEYEVADPVAEGGVRKLAWHYPSRTECMICHTRAANYVLGLQTLQMNRDHDYGRFGGRAANQLATLEHLGMLRVPYASEATAAVQADGKGKGLIGAELDVYAQLHGPQRMQREAPQHSNLLNKPPASLDKMPNPYDATADLNARARAYLHANCANCHVEAGGGNAMMELEFTRPPADMRLIGVDPLHGDLGLPAAKLVAPGDPEASVLPRRMAVRNHAGQPGQMPPLATHVPDRAAIELLRQWIAQLPPAGQPPPAAAAAAASLP